MSVRLDNDEVWAFVSTAHTGIFTSLRRDGFPVPVPTWFVALDEADSSHNKYIAPADYLAGEVARTIRAAKGLGAKLIRGFSFYQPAGADPWKYVDQAVERLIPIVEECGRHGLVYGLEVEANLIGQNGRLLAALTERVQRDNINQRELFRGKEKWLFFCFS